MTAVRPSPRPTQPAHRPRGRHAGAGATGAGPVVPFDYAAELELTGQPGRAIEQPITISPDAAFVAVAIGYGFAEDRARLLAIHGIKQPFAPNQLKLGNLPTDALLEGIRAHPDHDALVFRGGELSAERSAGAVVSDWFQRIVDPAPIAFLISLVDSSTGRELADRPAHSLAVLGRADGQRPFRPLAYPLAFAPNSTLRVRVVERTPGARGTLFIVLHGYAIVGASVCPEPLLRAFVAPSPVADPGERRERVVPFDSVLRFTLTGRRERVESNELTVSADGTFVATAIGYGLAPAGDPLVRVRERLEGLIGAAAFKPAALPLRALPPEALRDGIRIQPAFARSVVRNEALTLDLVDRLFETLNRPESVEFRYAIHHAGIGRGLQNQFIHSVAGLGIADGTRPFKRLARPLVLPPRSVLRMEIREQVGRGQLYVTFQGYRVLGRGTAS